MTTTGNVNLTIADNGGANILVPSTQVQVVIGCSSTGPLNQVVATRTPSTIQSNYGDGPMPQYAALAALGGATVLAIRAEINDLGTATNPVITNPGSSSSTLSIDLDQTIGAFDDYYVQFQMVRGGTLGAAGLLFKLSLDAGRNFGPNLVFPTGTTVGYGSESSTAIAFPAALAAGDTFVAKVDEQSVADTLTITATPALRTGSGETYAAVTAGHGFVITIAGVSGSQSITFAGTENSQALFHAKINQQANGFFAVNSGGHTRLTTNRQGSAAAGVLVSGDADVLASLGLTTGTLTSAGPNNVAIVGAVTAAELGALFDSTFTGGTAGSTSTVNANGSLTWRTNTAGASPKGVQFTSGTGVTKIAGFDLLEHNGQATSHQYAIPNTGITLSFTAGTLTTGYTAKFSTTAPAWNSAGLEAALTALQGSPYALTGWGSMHIVGVTDGATAAVFEDGAPGLDQLATGYIFTRAMISARDVAVPTAWGGPGGETESQWMAALELDFSAATEKRILCGAGYYNMPSGYPTAIAGTPSYRRPLTWAQAVRQVQIPPQRHSGRVSDGPLSNIVINPTTDPFDGFVYHDERLNPGFDYLEGGAGRFCSATTRIGNPGFFIVNPLLLSAIGSDFSLYPLGAVMDVACKIVHQVGSLFINSDVRTNPNGTIYDNAAKAIEAAILGAINDNMTAVSMISSATVSVDRTNNILTTKTVNITVVITARGYILQENVSIGYSNGQAGG